MLNTTETREVTVKELAEAEPVEYDVIDTERVYKLSMSKVCKFCIS